MTEENATSTLGAKEVSVSRFFLNLALTWFFFLQGGIITWNSRRAIRYFGFALTYLLVIYAHPSNWIFFFQECLGHRLLMKNKAIWLVTFYQRVILLNERC